MDNNLRNQMYNSLNLRATDDLLEIWQKNDTDEWDENTFEIVREILLERLGEVPPQSIETQVRQILDKVEEHLKNNELDKALSECEIAIQLDPNFAITYYYRGEIYDVMGQRENAIADYQKAIQLDPELEDARENMQSIESEIRGEIENQVWHILNKVEEHLKNNELDKALSECNLAIQMAPQLANAYNTRGVIYDEMGQPENALADYQAAVQLDPELEDAWDNLRSVEKDMDEKFQESATKQHLDQALEYIYNDEPEKAWEEYELAKPSMPGIAIAHNYLGMILEELERTEPAIDSYIKAIQLNPRFYAARENLGNARLRLEAEQYHQAASEDQNEAQEANEIITDFDDSRASEIPENDDLIPGWFYLDEKAFQLVGWPGHRTRQGRSGYDPLETDFELAHMQGVMIRLLMTHKFRTRNPIYLLLLACIGLVYCLPLILGGITLLQGNWLSVLVVIVVSSPYWLVGLALLQNVYSSLQLENPDEFDEDGCVFF